MSARKRTVASSRLTATSTGSTTEAKTGVLVPTEELKVRAMDFETLAQEFPALAKEGYLKRATKWEAQVVDRKLDLRPGIEYCKFLLRMSHLAATGDKKRLQTSDKYEFALLYTEDQQTEQMELLRQQEELHLATNDVELDPDDDGNQGPEGLQVKTMAEYASDDEEEQDERDEREEEQEDEEQKNEDTSEDDSRPVEGKRTEIRGGHRSSGHRPSPSIERKRSGVGGGSRPPLIKFVHRDLHLKTMQQCVELGLQLLDQWARLSADSNRQVELREFARETCAILCGLCQNHWPMWQTCHRTEGVSDFRWNDRYCEMLLTLIRARLQFFMVAAHNIPEYLEYKQKMDGKSKDVSAMKHEDAVVRLWVSQHHCQAAQLLKLYDEQRRTLSGTLSRFPHTSEDDFAAHRFPLSALSAPCYRVLGDDAAKRNQLGAAYWFYTWSLHMDKERNEIEDQLDGENQTARDARMARRQQLVDFMGEDIMRSDLTQKAYEDVLSELQLSIDPHHDDKRCAVVHIRDWVSHLQYEPKELADSRTEHLVKVRQDQTRASVSNRKSDSVGHMKPRPPAKKQPTERKVPLVSIKLEQIQRESDASLSRPPPRDRFLWSTGEPTSDTQGVKLAPDTQGAKSAPDPQLHQRHLGLNVASTASSKNVVGTLSSVNSATGMLAPALSLTAAFPLSSTATSSSSAINSSTTSSSSASSPTTLVGLKSTRSSVLSASPSYPPSTPAVVSTANLSRPPAKTVVTL